MAFVHSKKSRLLLGSTHLSLYASGADVGWKQNTLDTTVLNDAAKTSILDDEEATFTSAGYYDVTASTALASWKAASSTPVTFAPSGLAHGSEVWLLDCINTQYTTTGARGQVAGFSVTGQPTGPIDFGVSLHDLEAETADENGTSHDGTAATSGGAVAHLHVTAFSGLTDAVVTIEDSANNTDFAVIGTFATATGVTSERLAIAGTVRRYTRYALNVTGTGSVTFQASLARR